MEAQDQDSGGSLSTGKDRFYFDRYYKSKLKIQNDNKNKNMSAKFVNSIKIRIESEEIVESKVVFLSIKELIGASVKDIITMMQYKSNKVWIIQFKKEFNIDNIIGNEIKINNTKSTIQNACSPDNGYVYLIGVLRIHWFPTNLEQNEVEKHLKNGIKSVEIISNEMEYYKDPEQKHMSNGIIRLKIKYSIDEHNSVLALLGINEIADNRTLIQLAGHPPKCLFCSQFGHKVSDCESKKLFCTKCRKNGHRVSDCTMAKQISSPNTCNSEENQYNDQNSNFNNLPISIEKKSKLSTPHIPSSPLIRKRDDLDLSNSHSPETETEPKKQMMKNSLSVTTHNDEKGEQTATALENTFEPSKNNVNQNGNDSNIMNQNRNDSN
jgi:hypothetical protein